MKKLIKWYQYNSEEISWISVFLMLVVLIMLVLHYSINDIQERKKLEKEKIELEIKYFKKIIES